MIAKGTRLCFLLLVVAEQILTNEVDPYRLPDNVIPVNYILRLRIADIDSDRLSGSVTISFNTSEEANDIFLHASLDHIHITNIVLNAESSKLCNVTSYNEGTGIIKVSCEAKTVTNETNTLRIVYEAVLSPTSTWGIYKSKVYGADDNVDTIIVTQLAPSFARRLFPCFDEPRFKATFDLFLTSPRAYDVISNSPITVQVYTRDQTMDTQFDTSPPMSTYLLGFVIGKFQNISADATGINLSYSVFTRPELINHTGTALRYGPQLIAAMGNLTGIQYEDMNNVQLYQVALSELSFPAMENWGLLTYRETEILDAAEETTALTNQSIISIMAYQISHQWFGNYATLDRWSNSWLNEGFATYFQYHLPSTVYNSDWDLDQQFTVNVLQTALREDAFPNSPALSDASISDGTIDDYFKKEDYLTHGKGASVIRMMRGVLGEEKFQEGIKRYLQVNKFNTTNPTILLESLQLTNLMEPWIYECGYPVLYAKLKDDNHVHITQERFSNSENDRDSASTQWNIPVTYTTSEEKKFNGNVIEWLKAGETLTVDLEEGSWILLNIQQTGFYRVIYDDVLWDRLIVAVNNEERTSIHVLNRAQLVDDAFSLAQVGNISYIDAFSLADFLMQETEYLPWASALNALSYIIDHVTDEDTIALLKSRTLQYIESAFPKIDGESHIDILKQAMIMKWKCELGNKDCIQYTEKSFQEYQKSGRLPNVNEKEIIFCYGAKHSSNFELAYQYFLKIFKTSQSVLDKETILMAIGCIPDETVLSSFLGEMLDSLSFIPRTYSPSIFKSVLLNADFGCDVTLEFFRKNTKKFVELHGEFFPISTVAAQLSEKIRSKEQLGKLQEIIKNCNGSLDSKKFLNKVDYNMKWIAENSEKIKTSLIEHISLGVALSPSMIILLNLLSLIRIFQ